MKRVVLALILILWTIPLFAQASKTESKESMTCFSSSELEASEAAVQAEAERMAEAAVDAAVAPLYAEIEDQRKTIRNQTIVEILLGIAATSFLVWAAVK